MQYFSFTLKTRWIYLLIAIAAVFVLSFFIQYVFPVVEKPFYNQEEIVIEDGSGHLAMSYLSYSGDHGSDQIVLLPDVFYGADHLIPLAKKLSESVNVVIPLYPDSYQDGSSISQSTQSLAGLTATLIDSLGFYPAHIAGHGFGNGIAIDLLNTASNEYFSSHIMISGIGVQELNFLGYHSLNTAIYTIMNPVLWMVHNLVPHGGWAHRLPVNFQTASFLSSLDQRQMRNKLTEFSLPSLILHAENDIHVPVSTGREHHRIIPHSELTELEGGHDSIAENFELWANKILEFIERVNSGEAKDKSMATAERIELASEEFDSSKMTPVEGWSLIIIIGLIFFISLFSEDLAAIGGGLVVASGAINFGHALIGSVSGILLADIILYWLGRRVGSPALKWIPFRWIIKEKDVIWAESMFNNNSMKIIFASRFIPGSRLPTYFTAGMVKADFKLFLFYFIIAVSIWAPLLVGLSLLVGTQMLNYLEIYQDYAIYIVIAVILMVFLFLKIMMPLTTRKGRKEFAVKMIRLKQRWMD